jgi:glutamate dehydrogenase (NAD(P)+)
VSAQAFQVLDYPERLQKLLLTPARELHVELNITRDNGEIEIFNAYRVQHDNSRGPFKGGFRFHPNVGMDDVRRWGPKPGSPPPPSKSEHSLVPDRA